MSAPPEICNVASSGPDIRSFLRYRQQACLADPRFFFPSEQVQTQLLDDYFGHLRSVHTADALVVLDVKYAHVHNFSSGWWDLASRPLLLEYARKQGFRIVHLVRTFVYRTVVSLLYAEQSGVWRASSVEEVKNIRIRIDKKRLHLKARRLARTIAMFDDWLKDCPHITLAYEDVAARAPEPLNALRQYLSLEHDIHRDPGFVRTTPPYEEAIENLREIAHLLDVPWNDVPARPDQQPLAR